MQRVAVSMILCAVIGAAAQAQQPAPQLTAVRAGRLFDPEAGRVLANQIIRCLAN